MSVERLIAAYDGGWEAGGADVHCSHASEGIRCGDCASLARKSAKALAVLSVAREAFKLDSENPATREILGCTTAAPARPSPAPDQEWELDGKRWRLHQVFGDWSTMIRIGAVPHGESPVQEWDSAMFEKAKFVRTIPQSPFRAALDDMAARNQAEMNEADRAFRLRDRTDMTIAPSVFDCHRGAQFVYQQKRRQIGRLRELAPMAESGSMSALDAFRLTDSERGRP